MTIDVVIPNYNGAELIKKNLPRVFLEIKKYNGNVIIVDDFSKEKEFAELEKIVEGIKSDGKIILIRNNKNLGFSSTVNRGVMESKADFVVLLNTDVLPEEGFLNAALIDLKENEKLFGVGMMDRSVEGDKVILRGRGLTFWRKGFLLHKKGEVDMKDTSWVGGGSSVVRREIFIKLGGFDSLYNPFYWEDIDLSYRARKSGFEIMFEPKSIVEHRHEEGAIKSNYKNKKIKVIAYRNQFIFVWKNITDPSLAVSHVFWLPFNMFSALLRGDTSFFLGLFFAILKLPAIIVKRAKQVKLYKKSDLEII